MSERGWVREDGKEWAHGWRADDRGRRDELR